MDYVLTFSDLREQAGKIRLVDNRLDKSSIVGLEVRDRDLQSRQIAGMPSEIADLVDLAIAIYTSDRLCYRPAKSRVCYLHVELPLRNPRVFASRVSDQLEELLYWSTGDHWTFEFVKRKAASRPAERQTSLPFPAERMEVSLWSGGVDAFAGACNRMLEKRTDRPFALFGTGGNDFIFGVQRRVKHALVEHFPDRDVALYQLPFRLSGSGEISKNSKMRARGMCFLMLGAACAQLLGSNILNVYENGVGAINLPYRASQIGIAHARSVHPLTLSRISSLVSSICEESFSVQNPFVLNTKAQMCRSLKEYGCADVIGQTVSCDGLHRQKPLQCGYCSSCLLRRQSLEAADINDPTEYVITEGHVANENVDLHFKAMLEQVRTLTRLKRNTNSGSFSSKWIRFASQYPILDEVADNISKSFDMAEKEARRKIIAMYERYVSEWLRTESQIGNTLVKA